MGDENKSKGRLNKKKFQSLMEQLKDKLPEKELLELLEKEDLVEAATKRSGEGIGGGVKMGIYISPETVEQLAYVQGYSEHKGEVLSKNAAFRKGIACLYSYCKDNPLDGYDGPKPTENEVKEVKPKNKSKRNKGKKKRKGVTFNL